MELLIDADYIVYKNCAAAETELDFGEDVILVTSNFSDAYNATTNEIDKLLQDIAEEIAHINDVNTQVATATEEQATVVEDINRNINDISASSEETLNATQILVNVSDKLDELAQELSSEVSRFKL